MTEIEEEAMTDDMESNLAWNESRRIGFNLHRNDRFNLARNESRRIIRFPPGRNRLFFGGNPLKNYLDESELFPEKNNIDQEERELLNELQSFFEWLPGKNHLYCFAHDHRMTFYHDNNNNNIDDKVKCSACDKAIEYAMYGCPECPKIWFHKSCAELPREIKKHPFHTQHSLSLDRVIPADHSKRCSGCELPLGQGGFYGCKDSACKIFFHKFCLELPREIKHFGHPSHPLSLERELEKQFRCSACSADHTGLNYSCKRCDYNLGIRCIGKEATKRDGNPKGHVLTFFRKQPSEHRKSVCLICRHRRKFDLRFNLRPPVFHCKECKFSLHRDCVLPFALPLLPDTFKSKEHPHPLTLTNYFDPDIRLQVCDVCDQRIPGSSSFYYCKDCDFAEDLTCVLSEKCWSLAHNKVDHVELDIVPIVIDNPPPTVKEIIECLKREDAEELNKLVKAAIGIKLDQQDDSNKLDQPFRQIMQVFESKFGDKRFGLSYCQTRFQVIQVDGLDFTIPMNLDPICKVLVDSKTKYLNRKDVIRSSTGKTFIFMILCAAIYSLWTVEEVTANQLFTYWDCFRIAKQAGFEIQIAFDRLSKAMHAYLGLADTNCSVPNQDFDKEIKNIRSEMERLQITRTQRKVSMLVGCKDDGSRDSIEIEIVGENSWDEPTEVTSEEDFTSEESSEEDEEEEEEEEEEVGGNLSDVYSSEEEVGGNLSDVYSSEVGSEEEEDPSSNMMEDTPGEISGPEEDDIANSRDHQESPSEILKPDTKVGEEKLSEMPEPKDQKQAISKPPNPWDCNKKENLKEPAERIRYFNQRHPCKSLSLCNHRLSPSLKKKSSTSNGQISNKDGVKDEQNFCIACELPILGGKTCKCCSKCKIFLHRFCVAYPPEIQHSLHLLHPLKLKVDREKKEIRCNVCEEKCRGCVYYCCEECNFYLEARCLFQEPTVESKCHGKVFRFPEKKTINQNPRGCFACGKKIVPGSSSHFLRCTPCNVNLHVKCPISSRIIRSFHRHPLYFIPFSCGSQCNFCGKEMEESLRPSFTCHVCDNYFHIECATSNIL